jgi:hypothetical protein
VRVPGPLGHAVMGRAFGSEGMTAVRDATSLEPFSNRCRAGNRNSKDEIQGFFASLAP